MIYKTVKELMTALTDKMRGYLKTTDKIPSQSLPEKIDEVYEAGRKSQYDEFEKRYMSTGKRTNWQFAYAGDGWIDGTFNPGYDIILGSGYSGTSMFHYSKITNIAEILEKLGRRFDTSKCGWFVSMFNNAKTVRIPTLDLSNAHTYPNSTANMFASCLAKIIDKVIVNEQTVIASTAFSGCANLEEIRFEGVIGQNINLQWSKKLTLESLVSILTHLFNFNGSGEEWSRKIILAVESWDLLNAQGAVATNPVTGEACTWVEYVEACGWLCE